MRTNERVKQFKTTGLIFWMLFTILNVSNIFADGAFSVYVDNDSERVKPNGNTDRHYTSGVKLVYLTQPDWQWLEDFSTWHFGNGTESPETAVGYFLGQNIYTPDHADAPAERGPYERAYAGWLYTGMFAQRATDDMLDHLELSVGIIGPTSQAEEVQSWVHDFLGGTEPIGWNAQINDEPAVDLTFMRQQRLTDGIFKPTDSTDVIAEYGFTVGSVNRCAQAGVLCRYGFNLEKTFGPGRLTLPAGVSALRKDTQSQSGYLFARLGARAVEYNRFLTGLDTKPLLGEMQIGFVYQYKQLEISYSQTHMTEEYEKQDGIDSIGTLAVSLLF